MLLDRITTRPRISWRLLRGIAIIGGGLSFYIGTVISTRIWFAFSIYLAIALFARIRPLWAIQALFFGVPLSGIFAKLLGLDGYPVFLPAVFAVAVGQSYCPVRSRAFPVPLPQILFQGMAALSSVNI
jgi:hypothetical protein